MSQTNGSSEPSMEEILASIRNIIAQDPVRAPGAAATAEPQSDADTPRADAPAGRGGTAAKPKPKPSATATQAATATGGAAQRSPVPGGEFPGASTPFPSLTTAPAGPPSAPDPVLPLAGRSDKGAGEARAEPRLSASQAAPPPAKHVPAEADDFSDVFEEPLPKLSIAPTPFAPKPPEAKPAVPPPAGKSGGSSAGRSGIPPPPGVSGRSPAETDDKSLSDALAAVIGSRASASGSTPASGAGTAPSLESPAGDSVAAVGQAGAGKPPQASAASGERAVEDSPKPADKTKPFDFAALRARASQAIAPDTPVERPASPNEAQPASGGPARADSESVAGASPKGPTLIASMTPRTPSRSPGPASAPSPRPDAEAEAREVLVDPTDWSAAGGSDAAAGAGTDPYSEAAVGPGSSQPRLASANVGFLAAKPRPFDTADGDAAQGATGPDGDNEATEIMAAASPADDERTETDAADVVDAAPSARDASSGEPSAAAFVPADAGPGRDAQPATGELKVSGGATSQDLGTSLSTQGLTVSNIVVSTEGGRVKTLEDTVAELLRPLLREWLENNMPRIVENALRLEVADSVKKQFEATTRKPNGHGN